MSEKFEKLDRTHKVFMQNQHLYFVGTAGAEGFVNVSPKGMDSFRILDDYTVSWLNLTGSGNETAAHVLENGRMTSYVLFFRQAASDYAISMARRRLSIRVMSAGMNYQSFSLPILGPARFFLWT